MCIDLSDGPSDRRATIRRNIAAPRQATAPSHPAAIGRQTPLSEDSPLAKPSPKHSTQNKGRTLFQHSTQVSIRRMAETCTGS